MCAQSPTAAARTRSAWSDVSNSSSEIGPASAMHATSPAVPITMVNQNDVRITRRFPASSL